MTLALLVARAADARQPLPDWSEAITMLGEQRRRFDELLRSKPRTRIYGVNTLPGHRMSEATDLTPDEINRALLYSHLVGWGDLLDDREVAHVTAAKIVSLAQGGVPVRPSTFVRLVEYFTGGDTTAASVPRHASYSCGDVVPAAHWTVAALAGDAASLGPGEAMSLVNGAFVGVGVALALVLPTARTFAVALANEALAVRLAAVPRAVIAEAAQRLPAQVGVLLAPWLAVAETDAASAAQPPVSIRALPEVLALRTRALGGLQKKLSEALASRSGNPLFDAERLEVVNQASFLSLEVTAALGQVVDAVLAAMWQMTERLKYLVTSAGEGVSGNPIALIQYPKLMQAELERARRLHGQRSFASGGATSAGVEDFWGYTLPAANALRDLLAQYRDMLAVERRVLTLLGVSESTGDKALPLPGAKSPGADEAAWEEAAGAGVHTQLAAIA